MTYENSINTRAARAFRGLMHVAQQQINARLKPYVDIVPLTTAEDMAYDGIGTIEPTDITGSRNPDADFSYIEFLRRQLSKSRFFINVPIDRKDKRDQITDPDGAVARACTMAMNRQFDREVVTAANASVLTGKNFGTTTTFANDGGTTVTATGGLTYEKILELNKGYTNSEARGDGHLGAVLLLTGDEEYQLMQELELISGDFTRQSVVDNGQLMTAVGNKIICYGADVTNPILGVSSTTRTCISFMPKSAQGPGGIVVGMSKDIETRVEDRTDKVETTQVKTVFEMGAVRTEGKLVQELTTTTN